MEREKQVITLELSPAVQEVLDALEGDTVGHKIARLVYNESRRYLEACEREILELEMKYGMSFEEFQRRLQEGELGDPFSYPLEEDAMRWEDLIAEKAHWLAHLKRIASDARPSPEVNVDDICTLRRDDDYNA